MAERELDAATAGLGSSRVAAVFSWRAKVARMLEVEAALARAQAAAGFIPADAAAVITEACVLERFDPEALAAATEQDGTPVAPLVRALTGLVPPDAKTFVHAGVTTQDVVDTAMVLQVREALTLLHEALVDAADGCARLARDHRGTPMVARTLLQHAGPTSFGGKAAHWLHALVRSGNRLRALAPDLLVVQLGGASGTLAALGEHADAVTAAFAEQLQLDAPALPWHSNRDRVAGLGAELGILAGTVGKIATDLVLLAQTDVAEVHETAAGGSSALPHKRNPARAIRARAAAQLAFGETATVLASTVQEHERAAGAWWAEWVALPSLFVRCAGAVEQLAAALRYLAVDGDRMRRNLQADGLAMAEPLVTALARSLGWGDARALVGKLVAEATGTGQSLHDVAARDPTVTRHLSSDAINKAFDPLTALGRSDQHIDRALEAYDRLTDERQPT